MFRRAMPQRNNNYSEDSTTRMDPRVIVENTPSQFSFMGAAMQKELQRNTDMEAEYDFIYGDGYDSGHTGMADGADDNEVIMDTVPRDSALTQTLGIISSDQAHVVAPSARVEQVDGIWGEPEDQNSMIQRLRDQLMRSVELLWHTEYGSADEDGVRRGKNMLLGDILPLQIPARLPEVGGGSEVPIMIGAMSATNAGHVCGGADIPIEERLKYALLAHQKQRLKLSRVALQLHTETLMEKITSEEQARMECFFQMQCSRELGCATCRGTAIRQQLKVAEDAHIAMVEAELERHGAWLLQQELKWNVEEEELALLLLKNKLKDVAA